MAKRIECTFNSVNGENTGVYTRTSMTKKSPSPGILYKKNCPDGQTFYCEPVGGTNNYYKLINPSEYGIDYDGDVYVWLDKGHLRNWQEIDYKESNTVNTKTSTGKTVVAKPVKGANTQISTSSTYKSLNSAIKSTTKSTNRMPVSSSSVWPSSTYGETTISDINLDTSNVTRTSFFNDYSSFDSQLKIIEQNLNIGTRKGNVDDIKYNMVNKFNRFKLAYPDLQLTNSFSHIFFTRPDLNIYNDDGIMNSIVGSDPTFYYLNKNTPRLLKSLTSDFSKSHDFNPFLSNMAGSFELKDEVIQTIETAQTFTGHKLKYGRHNIESKTADSFSISYIDDHDYQIYKIHKAWTDYISKVYRGEFKSRTDNIRARVLDYACSVYYFLCAPDGETILFWTKYTGVFPTNTPSAASSWSKGSNVRLPDFTINYEYSWKEDFSPLSLAEFNINSKVSTSTAVTYAKTYENSITTAGKTFVGAPFIETTMGNSGYEFKLRFKMP